MKMKRFLTVIFSVVLLLIAFSAVSIAADESIGTATAMTIQKTATTPARGNFIDSSIAEGSTGSSSTALVVMAQKETSPKYAATTAPQSLSTMTTAKAPVSINTVPIFSESGGSSTMSSVSTTIIMTTLAAEAKEEVIIVASSVTATDSASLLALAPELHLSGISVITRPTSEVSLISRAETSGGSFIGIVHPICSS